jgi:hypothetical protein
MQINKKVFPLMTVSLPNGLRSRIDTNPDFQRPSVWSVSQKQLLIDTILRSYDIPKMYWRKIKVNPDAYEVVDGQQRLRAIWSFFDGEYALPDDAEPINGEPVAGLKVSELSDALVIQLQTYSIDVVVVEDTDEDEVREMFLRLQNGTSLKAQEKRNAMPGQMRDFVRKLTEHRFFNSVAFRNVRYTHDQVAAQLTCLEIAGEPVNVKNIDLNRMYQQNLVFADSSNIAKSVKKTLDVLAETFPEPTPELERFNVIALYCLVAELQRQYIFSDIRSSLHYWFLEFETQRRQQDQLDDDSADAEWISYKEKISHSTDAQESIRFRMEFMMRHLLSRFPTLRQRDNQRDFTHVQRLTIFRRDLGVCQLRIRCIGDKVRWDDWHCDHKIPWTNGGATTVENGQVACPACNLTKGAN